jgi:hypothetical protein
MILQKNDNATPSMVASLINRLPDDGDPQRSSEETIAKNLGFVTYAGTWCGVHNLILDFPLTTLCGQVALIL